MSVACIHVNFSSASCRHPARGAGQSVLDDALAARPCMPFAQGGIIWQVYPGNAKRFEAPRVQRQPAGNVARRLLADRVHAAPGGEPAAFASSRRRRRRQRAIRGQPRAGRIAVARWHCRRDQPASLMAKGRLLRQSARPAGGALHPARELHHGAPQLLSGPRTMFATENPPTKIICQRVSGVFVFVVVVCV